MTKDAQESDIYTSFDCAGMTFLLSLVPLIFVGVFVKPEKVWLLLGGGIVLALSLLVYFICKLTKSYFVGRVLDTLGCILAVLYVAAAIYLWSSPNI